MMIASEYKTISRDEIPAALAKAERYRLLNEPAQAESICHDVLAVEPDNQEALITLLLSLTDQFPGDCAECFPQAKALVPKLHGEYEQHYYRGLIYERRGHAAALQNHPGSATAAYEWLREAMDFFEQAEPLRPQGNCDAILRWNSCLRLIERYHLHPEGVPAGDPVLGDD
jgi:hypothetical protein